MLACVCAIADGVNEGRYPKPEFGADYCEQEPETPNAEPELPEDFEDRLLWDNPLVASVMARRFS
jgi:glutamine synthetase